MFKSVLGIFVLLTTLSLWAQTKSVGGPTQQYKFSIQEDIKLGEAFKSFTSVLLQREVDCRLRGAVNKKDSILDVYLRFNLKDSDGVCAADKEMKCIKNEEYKIAIIRIKNDPGSIRHISKAYNIDMNEAEKVFNYFTADPE